MTRSSVQLSEAEGSQSKILSLWQVELIRALLCWLRSAAVEYPVYSQPHVGICGLRIEVEIQTRELSFETVQSHK
jgi:hypothetical protein